MKRKRLHNLGDFSQAEFFRLRILKLKIKIRMYNDNMFYDKLEYI